VGLICEEASFTGQQLIDDEYLKYKGLTDEDLVCYRWNPNVEPPRVLAHAAHGGGHGNNTIRRGDVRKLEKDKAREADERSMLSKL